VNTERYKFIWETIATVALAAVAAVGPLLFPDVSQLLLLIVFWGGLGIITIATALRCLLLSKREARPREVSTATSVERKTSIRKRDLLWFFGIQVALGGYMIYAFSTAPEYKTGPSRQEITDVKEELSHLKPRTMILECADVNTVEDAGKPSVFDFLIPFITCLLIGLTPWITRRPELYCQLNIPKAQKDWSYRLTTKPRAL
jgi:hypothetical protein